MIRSIAGALRLSRDEHDHVLRLAGYTPTRAWRTDHVSPALMRVLDRLDTPAQVVSHVGWTLAQNDLAVALLGDQTRYSGVSRSLLYRWFCDPDERARYAPEDHAQHTHVYVSGFRGFVARHPGQPEVAELLERLLADSPEFAELWSRHDVAVHAEHRKRIVHPTLGVIAVECQTLTAEDDAQSLLVYTATPGTEDHERLRLLGALAPARR